MKVAFVCQPLDGALPPPRNSIGSIVYELATRLAKSQDVTVFSRGTRFRNHELSHRNVSFIQCPTYFDEEVHSFFQKIRLWRNRRRPFFASQCYYFFFALSVAMAVRRKKVDVVHIMNHASFISVIRRLNPGVLIVIHMECEWLTQLDRSLIASRLSHVDVVIGCSEFITENVKRCFPEFGSRCYTLYNGVDLTNFTPADAAPIRGDPLAVCIGYVGRVSPEKGTHILIQAFATVAAERPNVRLVIAGNRGQLPAEFFLDIDDDSTTQTLRDFYQTDSPDQYERWLEETSLRLGIDDQVVYHGKVEHSNLPAMLRTFDLFVFPSVWQEPFGMPPFEAMAAGVPVVATISGSLAELITDKETGMLVPRNDVDRLAHAMKRLIDDAALQKKLRINALRLVQQRLCYDLIASQALAIYEGSRVSPKSP